MATDGTGLKVIVPKLPAAHNGYIELYRNAEVAVFQYEPDKSGDIVAAKRRAFHGTLTADAEHRFNSVFASGRVLEAGCNARPSQISRRRSHSGPRASRPRQQHIRPIVSDFERWLDAVKPTLLPSEPLAAAVS
jgi:hypothetical protein